MNKMILVGRVKPNGQGEFYKTNSRDYKNKQGETVKSVSYGFYLDDIPCKCTIEPNPVLFGDMVKVTGELKVNKYEKDGVKNTMYTVEVSSIVPYEM